jgi:hypothetical protein
LDAERILAFRLARSGLADRDRGLVDAAACPASDFSRDAALLALAARSDAVTREAYDEAVDAGELVVGYAIRAAIHALAPADHALYGRALIATDDRELATQMGQQIKRLSKEKGFAPTTALAEVTAATQEALSDRPLDRNELHEELRQRVSEDLMPWCEGCQSHHVAPMLWRYATVQAGARLDAQRRYTLAAQDDAPTPSDAVRRFLHFYGPAGPADFAEWAGVAKPHGQRLWDEVELQETDAGWILPEDAQALESPPTTEGIRLLPPGDPYLQKANRALLTPDPALAKRMFRPIASPGAVLRDGRVAGLWRGRAKGRKLDVEVEELERLPRPQLEAEAERVAQLRGYGAAALSTSTTS